MLPAYAPYQPADPQNLGLANVTSDASVVKKQPAQNSASGQLPADLEPANSPSFSLRPVTRGRVLLTLNQLAVMSQNGIEIADAIENVAHNCRDPRLADSLGRIHEAVNSGQSLSHATGIHGVFFPTTLAPMLAAAEASGDVPQTLARVCHRMRGELQMRGTIVGAMIYPAILVGASSIVMCALVLGVLPQFSKVFTSMGKPIPIYTQVLLSFGDFCREYWMALLPAVLGSLVTMVMLRNHSLVQRPFRRFLMYGPFIRDAYRPLQAGRVLRTLASMVQGGVPLLQAVQLSQQTTGDTYWRSLLERVEEKLIDGLTASSAMEGVDFLPPETAQLMSTAERTGRVAEVLEDIGAFYEEEAERRIKRLVVALEPAIIVVMGVIVAAIVMSVMLPLLDVSTVG